MKQKWKALGICCLVLCLLMQCFLLQPMAIYAAPSASISFSSSTVKVGNTITATVIFSGGGTEMGSIEAEVTYDSSLLTFVSGDNANEYADGKIYMVTNSTSGVSQFSFSLTFKAKKAGSAALKAATVEFVTWEGVPVENVSVSKSLTVSAISTDATLKALSVNTGTLSPKFASGTTAYTVSVANNVSSITVNATATDSNAKVTGTGKTNLSVGKNTVSVKVTAEDGATTKTYTITVTRAAATPTPTKEPTKSPTKAPTSAPVTTTPPTTTTVSTETTTAGETPAETTPDVETPNQTATETPSETASEAPSSTVTETPATTTNTTGIAGTSTPTASPNGSIEYNGLFTVQAAFAFCAIGMFLVGGTVGFILCYVVKSKKRKNDDKDET